MALIKHIGPHINLVQNSVPQKVKNIDDTRELTSPFFTKHEDMGTCSTPEPPLAEKLKGLKDLPQGVKVENNMSTSIVKMKLDCDRFLESAFTYKWVKPEVTVQCKGNKIIKNEECVLDPSDQIYVNNLDGSREFSSNQLVISIKTENSETNSAIIDKSPEVLYDDWKITNEEIILKDEDLLEDSQSSSSGHWNQEKCDSYKTYKCHVCDYQSKWKNCLKLHLLKHKQLEEVDLFRCYKCEFVTIYKSALKGHVLTHKSREEVNLFKCDKCEFRTRYKNNLKTHQITHRYREKVKVFKCDNCQFQTLSRRCLKLHLLAHNCGFQTVDKECLENHLLRHENSKKHLFKCDKCEYRTSYKMIFRHHIVRHQCSTISRTKQQRITPGTQAVEGAVNQSILRTEFIKKITKEMLRESALSCRGDASEQKRSLTSSCI